ncbi:mitochondrial carrier domain-containing protein [Dichotomopilus funicola]|uniref:Mitochondrial carrier domain-containing protein n=1 Tax=Dichotomopilus funicola TaxID=1934379 RepID=A0AAN6V880_9PEZI|nr:mitochondrial carrier domain-containing protein [Dichotomopilus funicola]
MSSPPNRSRGDGPSTASPNPSPSPFEAENATSQQHHSASFPALPPGFNPGILPAIPVDTVFPPDKAPTSNAATGASAAGVRALTSQAVAFYFRAPVKAFFRTRVDYLAYARAIQEQEHAAQLLSRQGSSSALSLASAAASSSTPTSVSSSTPTSTSTTWLRARLRSTTPAVLASAVRHYGWRVVPDQILPPLVANVGVGAVLYTSYLQILARLHPDSGRATRRVYPPPGPADTFAAGFLAGAVQSVVAAPLDAVQARWDGVTSGRVVNGNGGATGAVERPRSMWAFSAAKLREIGVRGVFSGWGLSFLKDSMGSGIFFSVFEYVKAQGYYNFVRWYYGSLNEDTIVLLSRKRPAEQSTLKHRFEEAAPHMPTIIRPHYAIEPAFLLLAGMSASLAQQTILHPLSHVQSEHWERLESLDAHARKLRSVGFFSSPSNPRHQGQKQQHTWHMFRAYRDAYRTTWAACRAEAKAGGQTMRQWLYRGFWWNTIRQVPSTSAGLIIFELVRRKYGFGGEQVRINRDGYDILLN